MKLKKTFRDKFIDRRGGFGMNELLGIAAALIIAAFIIIPSMQEFAQALMDGLSDWWNDIVASKIFPDTL